MKLTIGYFYSKDLNLYGDTGNVEILKVRAQKRNIDVEVIEINSEDTLSKDLMSTINCLFMGGGPDSSQKNMYVDLLTEKKPYLQEYIENHGVGLFICGSYQLLGKYYKSADGDVLDGLNILDFYTENFGLKKPRCIGNVYCEISNDLRHDKQFNINNKIGSGLVGFENHGGRTYLGESLLPLATVLKGYGNNGVDKTEGVLYKNIIGTYLHGPILARNAHLADYLLSKALQIDELQPLDDQLIMQAHSASMTLKQ